MANGTKDWNVMVYLAGDNNLSEEMVWALTEMERIKNKRVTVKARFDPRGAGARSYNFSEAQSTGTRAAHVASRKLDEFKTEDLIEDLS